METVGRARRRSQAVTPPEDGRQMGWTVPDGRWSRVSGSFSRPFSSPSETPPATCAVVEALRRRRHTGKQIAAEVGVSPATVSRVLRRLGLNRIRNLEPAEPVRRYERAAPGEMIHIDSKKLGRIDGIGHRITGDRTGQSSRRGRGRVAAGSLVHVAIDDAFPARLHRNPTRREGRSASPSSRRALAYYKSHGIKVERVMTDNGSLQKLALSGRLHDRGIKHIRTRPYTPTPTARPNASSRPRLGSGLMLKPTRHQIVGPRSFRSGSTDTIGIGRTAA